MGKTILTLLFALLVIVGSVDGNTHPMVGSFELEDVKALQTEEMTKLLHAMEVKPDDVEMVQKATKVTIDIKKDDSGYTYLIKGLVDQDITKSFESGKEFKNKRFDGRDYVCTITIVGRTVIREATYDTFKAHHVATFCPGGMDVLFTVEKGSEFAKARIDFKRV